ncbi:ribose-5-phosphate isomerase 3 [Populus alba x Populus x berolinensis]|nr:ribose-5-phosphate isomerase 3 [Populus alba x Populus x berolinensis]
MEMESNSMVDVPLKKDIKVSSSDNEKVDEHGVSGVYLNEDGEVETPKIGMVFASQEEVRDYYNRYAQRVGFGIMRRSSRCDDDGRLTYIVLSCSQCGKDRGIPKSRFQWKQTSKTNCKAKINLVLNPQGQFHICNVVLDHNHELTPGKLHPNICKKSKSFRTRKGREGKEQAGMMLHPDFRSIFGEPLGSETASPDSVMQRSSFSNHLLNGDKHLLCSYTGLPTGETISNRLKRRSPSLEAQDSLRQALAKRAVALVKSGMVIGLGTGRTLTLVIEEIGKLIQEGKLKDIVAVGTNYQSRITARQYGMTTVDPNDVNDIDIAFDVVDEVDINKNLLKCRGANHTVQKVIDSMAKVCILLVEHSKVVHRLGNNIPVAVEVLPIAVSPVLRRLIALGGVPEIRSASRKDGSVITDLGNMVVDVSFPSGIQNPAELEKNINMIPGVVDNGIFSAVATIVLVVVRDRGNIRVMNLEEFLEGVPGHRDAIHLLCDKSRHKKSTFIVCLCFREESSSLPTATLQSSKVNGG